MRAAALQAGTPANTPHAASTRPAAQPVRTSRSPGAALRRAPDSEPPARAQSNRSPAPRNAAAFRASLSVAVSTAVARAQLPLLPLPSWSCWSWSWSCVLVIVMVVVDAVMVVARRPSRGPPSSSPERPPSLSPNRPIAALVCCLAAGAVVVRRLDRGRHVGVLAVRSRRRTRRRIRNSNR